MRSKRQSVLASLDELMKVTVPGLIKPVPHKRTVERLLKAGNVPFWKANVRAPHGGGRCYYQVSAVKRLFRVRRPAKAPTTKQATPRP
jgi:hypothetical protein